jgi:hypothetical protein
MPFQQKRKSIAHTYSVAWPAMLIAGTLIFLLWWTAH